MHKIINFLRLFLLSKTVGNIHFLLYNYTIDKKLKGKYIMKNNNILKNFKKPIAVSLAIANLFTFAPSSSATIVELNSSGEIELCNGTKITEQQLQYATDEFYKLYDEFVDYLDSTKNSSNVLYKLADFLYSKRCFVARFEKEDKKSLFVCFRSKFENIRFLFAIDDAIKHFQLFSQGGQNGYEECEYMNTDIGVDFNILRPDFFTDL